MRSPGWPVTGAPHRGDWGVQWAHMSSCRSQRRLCGISTASAPPRRSARSLVAGSLMRVPGLGLLWSTPGLESSCRCASPFAVAQLIHILLAAKSVDVFVRHALSRE